MGFMPEAQARKKLEQKDIVVLIAAPLFGTSDGILTECLHQAGITRGDVSYIYMKDNDYEEMIAEVKPKVVITVDDPPLKALTHRESSYKFRGSPIFKDDYVVIPLMRPSLCMSVYTNRYFIVSDLRKAKRIATTDNYQRPNPELIIFPSFEQSMQYMQTIKDKHKEIAFDIECCNQEVSCISFATSPNSSICIPFYGNVWTVDEDVALWKIIADVLHDNSITKIGQNLMFDIAFLARQNNIITRGLIEDTMIGHNTIYKDFPKGLDFLCSIYTDFEYYKDDGKIWKTPEKDLKTFYLYSARDSAYTYACWVKIKQELKDKNFMPLYRNIMSIFNPLLYMQLRGLRTDHKELSDKRDEVNFEIGTLQKELDELCGMHLNVASPKQCKEYFYITKNIKPYMNKGKITTDDKAMRQIARKGHKEAKLVQDIRGRRKLVGTYLDIAFDSDGRLRSSYNLAGTSFGRLSSAQTIFGTGTNFQNLPPSFRGFLKADPGMVMIELDKAQAEWVVVAHLANDANMIEVFNKRLDAHSKTASLMFGASVDLIKEDDKLLKEVYTKEDIYEARREQLPEILKYFPIDSMSCRQIGKKCNHGLNYDLAANGFSMSSDIELKISRRIVEMYHNAYPGIRNTYHYRVQEQLRKDRTQTNCFGRKRIFLDRWGDSLFKAAYAMIPQSSVGDMVNFAIREIYNDMTPVMRKVDMLGQVHDSIVMQYPLDSLPDLYYAIKICQEYLDIPMTYNARTFVIPTDVKVGFSWGHMTELPDTDFSTIKKVYGELKEEQKKLEQIIP